MFYLSRRNNRNAKYIINSLLLLSAVFISSVLSFAAQSNASGDVFPITILYTNDHHSHLTSTKIPQFGGDLGGIARRYEVIKAIRASEPSVLLFDGGDIFQGTPFYTFFKGEADIAAYSMCGYDAITLGNHDLDDGLANTLKQYEIASFSLLCANVVYNSIASASHKLDSLVFKPFQIMERGGIRIGIIGVIGPGAWEVTTIAYRSNLRLIDPVYALKTAVSLLRPHVDLIVVISHSGYDYDMKLATEVGGIDLIVGGHTNTYLEKPTIVRHETMSIPPSSSNICGTLVVQAFKWGAFLGRIDLLVKRGGPIISADGKLIPINASITVPLDSPMLHLVEKYQNQIKDKTDQVVGYSEIDFNYPEQSKHIVTLPLGSLVAQSLLEFTNSDMAIINSGCIRESLSQGPITIGRIFTILPFDNTVVTLEMSGEDIIDMFDFICTNYGKITGYQFAGVTATIDLASHKVHEIKIGNNPIETKRIYRVATLSYLADGNQHGDKLFKNATNRKDNGYYYREAFLDYVRRHGKLTVSQIIDPLKVIGLDSITPTYDR